MKGSRLLIAITIATTLALIPSAIAAPKTTSKAAGRVTTTVVNTILSGSGVPSKTLGINGDFYIDTKNLNLYGPKTKGVWKVATSLKQTDTKSVTTVIGETGSTGEKGDKGDKGATGSTGATGSAGVAGVAGAKGSDGAVGASGATGLAGSNGATGPSGSNGSAGAAGSTGPAGASGGQGIQGVKGDTGNVGATGAAGPAGMSVGFQSPITFEGPLAGALGSIKTSTAFGNFSAGKNYVLRILISTYDANLSMANYGLGFGIAVTAGTVTVNTSYVVMNGTQYSAGNRIYISVVADVVLNGTSNLDPYSLIVTLTSGANGGASISAMGTLTKIEVGSVG